MKHHKLPLWATLLLIFWSAPVLVALKACGVLQ